MLRLLLSGVACAAMVCGAAPETGPGASAFVEIHEGLQGMPLEREFATDTADRFGPNWRALRIPLANARSFETLPAFFTVGLQLWYGESFEVYSRFPLRRDMEAWYQDEWHSLQALGPNEVDLNVPTESWAKWNNPLGFVQVGRFKPEIGPGPNSLVVGGAPWHDGLWWKAEAGMARYEFFLSSLNSFLIGTPDSAGAAAPEGSEAWVQQHATIPNQRNRIYAEPHKNLLLHRMGVDFGKGWIAVIEQSLVGGKSLDFRDFNPFAAWHNNFGDGYTKASTTFEAGWRPGKTSTFYWQFDMEDIASPVGETSGETNPTTIGALAGYLQNVNLAELGVIQSRFDAVYTDPVFNNHRVPLQKMTSRRSYRSNYRDQTDIDFADVYLVDYPLGYRRGSDAVDLWWRLDYRNAHGDHGASLEMGWLRQGSCSVESDYDSCSGYAHALSGVVEDLRQADLTLWVEPWTATHLYAGVGLRKFRNLAHDITDDGYDGWGRLGVRYTLGHDRHPHSDGLHP